MEFINISNVKIENNEIEFEFLYKSTHINENIKIFFEDDFKNKYESNFYKCKNSVFYSYNNENTEIGKVTINLLLSNYGKLKLKALYNDQIIELKIHNNKNEEITEKENPYIIFYLNYKINISTDEVEISVRKFGDKLKYEINKQIYGIKKYKKIFIFRFFKKKQCEYYLFNDRLLYGDDNAEELFKYVNENKLSIAKKSYFVLDKNSESIERIKKYGKILIYGSFKHKLKYLNCKMVISSHSSYLGNCFNPFDEDEMNIYKDITNKKFIFLQHGVVMNDVREYCNRELILADLFITSTHKEYNYLSSEDFMYRKGMIVKTGLPRFDKLKNSVEKIILISPTWRNYDENINFEDSEYYKVFSSLLKNDKLNNILKTNNYKIEFLLHPVFAQYKNLFNDCQNEHVKILESNKTRYCEIFNRCSVFITDYSSIHFDVATLKKPMIYYQFDKEFFFNKHYKNGYFDYDKDGFGKILEKEEDIVYEIYRYIKKNCEIDQEYNDKIDNTFVFLDHNNCNRVYKEIEKIDKMLDINYRFNNVH